MAHQDPKTVNQYFRVCSAHFEGGRKAGKDIPSAFAWTKKVIRHPPKDRTTNVTSQGNHLSEEDAEPENFSCNPKTVDLESMVDKVTNTCIYHSYFTARIEIPDLPLNLYSM